MSNPRAIHRVVKSRAVVEGAGLHLHRTIGFDAPERYDPFLLLDDFRSDRPEDYVRGFPWHPHRGMGPITYVLRGEVEHGVTGPVRDVSTRPEYLVKSKGAR